MTQELRLRILSGLVLAAIVLFATWLGGILFVLVAVIIALAVYREWTTLTRINAEDHIAVAGGWAVMLMSSLFLSVGSYVLSAVVIIAGALAAGVRARQYKTSQWLAAGLVYAGFTSLSLVFLRGDSQAGFSAVLFLFTVVWITDIAAYFIGRTLRGPKLAPSISPGKTWSGAIGGTVMAVLAGTALFMSFGGTSVWSGGALAFALSVVSQAGDLFESFIKRRFGAKDSGHLIPGHGGMMDRVDGLVFASILMFLLTWIAGMPLIAV
jgi:phosphatidate cytidylyltransferase